MLPFQIPLSGRRPWLSLACLVLLVLAVYGQTGRFDFVSFDDGIYVYNNARVKTGLNEGSLAWAMSFDEKDKTYWHPLTWLSHMADVELFGLNPGAHHLSNVLLHTINTCLLFMILIRMNAARGLSLLVAALFAVHPVHVESVAWVAERKNVLSTAFWLLTTYLYIVYVQKPNMKRYAAMLLAFTFGLLAKPMLVTLPCTLLLLDFWPLGRIRLGQKAAGSMETTGGGIRHLWEPLLDKIPLFLLSCLVTYLAMGSIRYSDLKIPFEAIPLGLRIENIMVSYVTYLAKAFWPSGLAMFYPYPESLPAWQVWVSALVLAAVTAGALACLKTRPYFIMGWLWFLGTLVPVSGLVQVGLWPAWADRWAYIPYIGLSMAVIWGARDLAAALGARSLPYASALSIISVGLLTCAGHLQAAVWESGFTLYQSAIERVPGNYLAHNNLGVALCHANRLDEGVFHYRESIRINPLFPFPYFNLGRYYMQLENYAEAERNYQEALALNPEYGAAHMCMGETMARVGNIEKAFFHYKAAQQATPYEKKIYNDVGVLFLQIGNSEDAIRSFKAALRLDPWFAEAHNNIGFAYLRSGQTRAAIDHLEKALTIDPGNGMAQESLREARSGGNGS